jgi:hypothetical protein
MEKGKGGRREMEKGGRWERGEKRRMVQTRSREKGKEGEGKKKTKCTLEKEADGMRGKEP